MAPLDSVLELREWSREARSITLSKRQLCDLELLLNGGFKPLQGFMDQANYQCVLEQGRLADGTLWTIPIVLAISEILADQINCGDFLSLCDSEGFMLARLQVNDVWKADRESEAEAIFGTTSRQHPGVRVLLDETSPVYVAGPVEALALRPHYDFAPLWRTPDELRQEFYERNWDSVIAFQASRPMHRIERDTIVAVAKDLDSKILLLPVVGESKSGDLEHFVRIQCCKAIFRYIPENTAFLSLLPISLRMAGPRETLWHGIIHRNYGCSAFIVGPDDSSPPILDGSNRFYKQYAAQEYASIMSIELGIDVVPIEELRYSVSKKIFMPASEIEQQNEPSVTYSDYDLRRALATESSIPEWFSFPDVINCLSRIYLSNSRVGITLFFTGLSGSGKSTLARMVQAQLIESGQRSITLLDGDIVRQHLSSELGFSREHRDLNIRRIGFVANEISKNGGVAICAPIAPYRAIRREIRALIEQYAVFVEIYLSAPVSVCEERDRKGLYARARAGELIKFTGISDPYEVPEKADLVIDTSRLTPAESYRQIIDYLMEGGLIQSSLNVDM